MGGFYSRVAVQNGIALNRKINNNTVSRPSLRGAGVLLSIQKEKRAPVDTRFAALGYPPGYGYLHGFMPPVASDAFPRG